MAETLGMLCDKLTIVRLKAYHTEDEERLNSLAEQTRQLQEEIDAYLAAALTGSIHPSRLTFASNKVYDGTRIRISGVEGSFGAVFAELADVNCRLWHEQEKVYAFEQVPPEQKDAVVRQLAVLNLERNACIDAIDRRLAELVEKLNSKS